MPTRNITQKLIDAHLLDGKTTPGREIGLWIDQTLTQDATGTLVMLELEAMDIDRNAHILLRMCSRIDEFRVIHRPR